MSKKRNNKIEKKREAREGKHTKFLQFYTIIPIFSLLMGLSSSEKFICYFVTKKGFASKKTPRKN